MPDTPTIPKTCPLCGQINAPGAESCAVCGAKIGRAPEKVSQPARKTAPATGGPSLFQSWKFTAGVGAVLVAGLVMFIVGRGGPEKVAVEADPHGAEMMKDIRDLQARIEANPEDRDAMLRLANRLYDVQFFDRAAVIYERYLGLEPGNVNARVDLGTSYFQMSFSDSTKHEAYQRLAEATFLEAIRVDPSHQLANFNLGIVHLHRGDMAGARQWFEKCIALGPGTEPARRAKELLSQHIQTNP